MHYPFGCVSTPGRNGDDEVMTDPRIVHIELDERTIVRRSPDVEHERKVAIFDLLEENHFAPKSMEGGPYRLKLGLEESRLKIDVTSENAGECQTVYLPLLPFRRIIKEYFLVCESYFQAIKTASPSQIETIDMGRRGLHDEGSRMLKEKLDDRIEMDFDTARRLFTLVCVLHLRNTS